MSFLTQIESYYKVKQIHPLKFTCGDQDDCKKRDNNFTGPTVGFIGTKYGSKGIPRLVFLSLDSGGGPQDPNLRTAIGIRRFNEKRKAADWNVHWRETNEFALQLLKQFVPEMSDLQRATNQVTRYFSHTNSAKCCQNKEGAEAADARLFRNCRHYIGQELVLLRPDVLVTQGKPAFDAVIAAIDDGKFRLSRPLHWRELRKGAFRTLRIGVRDVLWFPTFHPRYGGYYTQKKLFQNKWVAMVVKRGA